MMATIKRAWDWSWRDVGMPRPFAIFFYTWGGINTIDWIVGWFS